MSGEGTSVPTSGSSTPNARFVSQNTVAEDHLKSQTVGLVHLDDFRKRRAEAIDSEVGTQGRNASTPYVYIVRHLRTRLKDKVQ